MNLKFNVKKLTKASKDQRTTTKKIGDHIFGCIKNIMKQKKTHIKEY